MLILAGLYTMGRVPTDWLSYVMMGIGLGIYSAVAGSLLHNALAGRCPS